METPTSEVQAALENIKHRKEPKVEAYNEQGFRKYPETHKEPTAYWPEHRPNDLQAEAPDWRDVDNS